MRSVWKFAMEEVLTQIRVPMNAKILALQTQRGVPCLWILVDTEAETEIRSFVIRGTGHEIPGDSEYVGTFQVEDGTFVFHVFEVRFQ